MKRELGNNAMNYLKLGAAAWLLLGATAPAIAQPVDLLAKVFVEQRTAAADGSVKIILAPAARVTPGDRVVYQFAYRNTGAQVARDLVIANPVPANLVYTGPAAGSPEPELSIDGSRFGPLGQLSVRTASGATRAATAADVRVVRWRLAPLAGGAAGQVAFRATLK